MRKHAPIVITGGAQRLGLANALHLRHRGFNVIVTYRSERPGLSELHAAGIETIKVDFAQPGEIDSLVDALTSRFSALRGIIHNASDWRAESDDDNPAHVLSQMHNIHVAVPYLLNLRLQELLLANSGKTDIIHMTDYVQQTGSKKHIAYAASKAAMHSLTLSFASLLAPNVCVNSIAPALVMFNDDDSPEYKAKALNKSLLKRCPGAQEVVRATEYLLTSEYVTGETLNLNGGRHLK